MRSLRLVPYWSVHETLGVDAHNAPLKMRTRRIHLSHAGAWSCVRRHPVAGTALGSTDVEGSDPPGRGPGTGAGPGVFSHAGPRHPGVAPVEISLAGRRFERRFEAAGHPFADRPAVWQPGITEQGRGTPDGSGAADSACRWRPCGCTTAARAATPIRSLRPWRERDRVDLYRKL